MIGHDPVVPNWRCRARELAEHVGGGGFRELHEVRGMPTARRFRIDRVAQPLAGELPHGFEEPIPDDPAVLAHDE